VSIFVDTSHLALLVTLSGMAAIRGAVLTKSIEEEDAGSVRGWAKVAPGLPEDFTVYRPDGAA
jgi:hypothetical protein